MNISELVQALQDKFNLDKQEKEMQYSEMEVTQDEYDSVSALLLKRNRQWQIADVVALIVLILLLLYSVTTVIYYTKYATKKYQVNLVADTITVDESQLKTRNSKEILSDSKKNGYISNCMEFYYDAEDGIVQKISEDNTTYYSIDDMQKQIETNKLNYTVKSVEEVEKEGVSTTKVANQEFVYGFNDGSSQEAVKDSNELVWKGYSPVLVRKYMETVRPYTVERTPAYIVIDRKIDVDDAFIEAMMKGVIDDTYMNNRSEMSNGLIDLSNIQYSEDEKDDYFYGFHADGDKMLYTCSHKIGETALGIQYIKEYDVLGILEKNIEEYLGKDVNVTTQIPKVTNRPLTIIYLATENFCYDSWYILGNQYEKSI